jgi:hypothetical protein
MAYIGSTPTTQSFISGTDYFNGTGSATAFTMSRAVASVNDIQAVVNNVVQVPNDAYTISGTTITFTSAPSAGTSNVYVRYLSTTTQVITPSQNTVSWNTLDANTQQDLGISFKNRIINGNMVINQRALGTVTINTSGTYTIDRWQANQTAAGKFTVQQSSAAPAGFKNSYLATSTSAYSVSSSDIFFFNQNIEGYNMADLEWGTANAKTVTLSAWVQSSLTGTFGGAIANATQGYCYPFSFSISTANTWTQISVTITGATSGTWDSTNGIGMQVIFGLGGGSTRSAPAGAWTTSAVYTADGAVSVVGTNGATFYLTGVQFEVGTQATTFTTAGGSYGAELALCQRYLQVWGGASSQMLGTAWSFSTTSSIVSALRPVTMRTSPTLTSSTVSDWTVFSGGAGSLTATSIIQNRPSPFSTSIEFGVASGLTSGQAGAVFTANANARIYESAEL